MNLAPAGTTRGKVDAIRARKNLKNGESDELYENNVNPVRMYAQEGIVIMGQKTLRAEDDLLNRIDVRRMVMRMRKLIAIACLGLIFEPNDNNTVKSFKSIISGVMQTFMDNRAIQKWTMDVDDSQEARDRLELGATIYVMPTRALEYITLNFVVTNNDVYFEA
jgi:phage tail sheath protein FI